eukprot:g20286.t1
MIMLLSSLYQAAGEPTGEERAKTSDWSWTIFVICALLGALSISRWLWHCIKQFFLGYIVEVMRTKIPEDNTYQKVEVASVEIQAGCWIDLKALGVYEQESIKMQDKLFQLDLYIEELQEEFNQAREERNCRFQQLQILEGHAQKLMGQYVALYDFDPSVIDWQFPNQSPLPLKVGNVVEVLHDGGTGWVYGHLVGAPDSKGFFPLNYTAPMEEYLREMERLRATNPGALPGEDLEIPIPAPPRSRQADTEVSKGTVESYAGEVEGDRMAQLALGGYPALSAEAPVATSYQLSRPTTMPALPTTEEGGPASVDDELLTARQEIEAELPFSFVWKKDRDYVRRNLPMNLQQQYLRRVSGLQDIVNKHVKVPSLHKQLFTEDLRVRAATIRMSYGMEPPHLRMALEESAKSGARWSQMFRPGFNDIVNETFKVGANADAPTMLWSYPRATVKLLF